MVLEYSSNSSNKGSKTIYHGLKINLEFFKHLPSYSFFLLFLMGVLP